jgi:hypothetical protein
MKPDETPRERPAEPAAKEADPPLAEREVNPGDPGPEQPEPRTPDDPACDDRLPEDAVPPTRGI